MKYFKTEAKRKFLKLVFRFTGHRQIAKSGETLVETIQFCIDDNSNRKTVYEQAIEFNETHFINIVNKEENQKMRQQWLLDIASELMPDLKSTERNTNETILHKTAE